MSRLAWVHSLAVATCLATLFLVFAGGMVTSTGSGLAVPDWPLSYGTLFPDMVGGVFYEHGHRLMAGGVALLTALLALVAWRFEPRPGLRRLAAFALGAVLLQATLGGITVLTLLPVAVSVAHATLANLFFAAMVALALLTSPHFRRLPHQAADGERRPYSAWWVLSGAVLFQMILGALMRHTGAGLAVPDFPLAFGRLLPPLDAWPVAIHMAHRAGAAILFLIGAILLPAAWKRGPGEIRLPASLLALLLPLQIGLGAATIWTGKGPVVTSLHVVTGTAIFGASLWGALAARRHRPAHSVRAANLATEAA